MTAHGNLLIRNATAIAIATVTLLVLASALLLYRQTAATGAAQAWVLHTHQVKENTEALLTQIETGMIATRDYLLEGKEEDLKPYASAFDESAPGNVFAQLATLHGLISDNPVQQRNLDALEPGIKNFQAYLTSLIELRKSQNAAALANADPTRGKQLLNDLRNNFAAMIGEEDRLLAARAEADQLVTARTDDLIFAALAVFYIAAVLAIFLCRSAERRAQGQTRLLAAIVESAEEAIIGKSLDGFITSWNAGAEALLGYTAAEAVGQPVKLIVPPERGDEEQRLMTSLRQGEQVVRLETLRLAKDGARIDVSMTLSPIRDRKGAIIGISTVMHDIRVRKRAEREIQKHMDALKRSNQELDDFAYIASHDLKEPLRGLTNNANFMRDDLAESLTPEVTKRLDRMIYLCQRLERLVDDLLYFSRLGRQELAIQKTDLNEVIKDINLTMETTLHDANAVIVTPEALPTIVCDLPRVTEVFRNLIVNGVKYNKNTEKRIEIGCIDPAPKSAGNDNVGRAFYVRDNGIGIPKEFYNDVFRIFKRLNAEDDSAKGTGVGLTFVRKIIERHGGKIWLDSEVGKGTTFYFTLNTKKEAS